MWLSFDHAAIAEAMARAQSRGVRVRMVTDGDTLASRSAIRSAFATLQGAGVPIVADERRALMHHKFSVVDGEWVATGPGTTPAGIAFASTTTWPSSTRSGWPTTPGGVRAHVCAAHLWAFEAGRCSAPFVFARLDPDHAPIRAAGRRGRAHRRRAGSSAALNSIPGVQPDSRRDWRRAQATSARRRSGNGRLRSELARARRPASTPA